MVSNQAFSSPASPTLIAPLNKIDTSRPEFTWADQANTTKYVLYVYDRSARQRAHLQTHNQSDVCHEGVCSFTPDIDLGFSSRHSWRLKAQNSDGNSSWSGSVFSYLDTAPSKVITTAPEGEIVTSTPAFEWNNITNATEYLVYIRNRTTQVNLLSKRYASADICTASTCSVTPENFTTPDSDTLYFRVRASNSGGWGEWSAEKIFTRATPPGKVITLAPEGEISTRPVLFKWQRLAQTTHYQLFVLDPLNKVNLVLKQYPATEICAATTCEISPANLTLPEADVLRFRIRAKNIAGWGKWSTHKDFFINTTIPDTTPPEATITQPAHKSVAQYPLLISGMATDNKGISSVELVIKDIDTGQFWNGTGFQQSVTRVAADLSQTQWSYELDTSTSRRIRIYARATDSSGNKQTTPATLIADTLACSHFVKGTATPANSGTPEVIDSEAISYTTGTVISANFFNSGAIIDRQGRTVSICVTEPDSNNNRRAQILTDVGQTDNTAIKAYPAFIIGSKFGLVGETSYRPYPLLTSSTGFTYPDLENIAGLIGLPARTSDLPDIDIVLDIDEQNVQGAERDVMLESWFYDLSANTGLLGTDAAGNSLEDTLNNIVGDGHPNPSLMNLTLEMMVHVGALSPNDASGATRNPSQHKLTQTPVTIGNYQYHIWHGDTHLAPLVVFSRETDINGNFSMDLTREGKISLDWNLFLDYTLNDLEGLLAEQDVPWATGSTNIFPALRSSGAVGALEIGIEPQTNNAQDQPYTATFNTLDVTINGQQFGFK